MSEGLFGDDFDIVVNSPGVKGLVKKAKGKVAPDKEEDIGKVLKSKAMSIPERLAIINQRVLAVLSRQKDNVIVIKTKQAFHDYISSCIATGRIDIDTETNNSLDPVTCKIMGPCFYAPGLKQAYVPINHVDYATKQRLPWQLKESDVQEELKRVLAANTFVVMHNGKFDYEVLKCTCGVAVPPNWDTIVGARLMDENEFKDAGAKLKYIYAKYIDPEQEKYDIEELFENIQYAYVDPDIFALYAATDAMMTDKVYERLEKPFFDKPENKRLYENIFMGIEMPIVVVTAEMELAGITVDEALGAKLKDKYNAQLAAIDDKIKAKLDNLKPLVAYWKLLPSATDKPRVFPSKKSKMTPAKLAATYTIPEYEQNPNGTFKTDKAGNKLPTGRFYKEGRPKMLQIDEDINLASPSQLAILFYDVLRINVKNNGRGTGEAELQDLADKLKDPGQYVSNAVKRTMADVLEAIRRMKVAEAAPILQSEDDEPAQPQRSAKPADYSMDVDEDDEDYDADEDDEDESDDAGDSGKIKTFSVQLTKDITPDDLKTLEKEMRPAFEAGIEAARSLCQAILDRRAIVKLVTTYIDVIPELAQHWPDHRIRFHLNSLGTDTGRYSSGGKIKYYDEATDTPVVVSGINIQNIPGASSGTGGEVRMLFKATEKYGTAKADAETDPFVVSETDEIETETGWKYCKDLAQGDRIIVDGEPVEYRGRKYDQDSRSWQILAY